MCVIRKTAFSFLVHSKYMFITCSTPFLSKPLIIKQNKLICLQYGNKIDLEVIYTIPVKKESTLFNLQNPNTIE